MNPVPLFWAIAFGIILLFLMPRIHRTMIEAFSRQIGVAESNRESAEALVALQEARRQLALAEAASRDLVRQRTHLNEQIAECRRDIGAPRRERIDLVFELGTPRLEDGHSLFAANCLPGQSSTTAGNGRQPDPQVWRQPRLVRVWGKNASLCQSMAEQRFGSKRDFDLVQIDEHQRARLGL
ncbi:MAG TPA: hypothetical protein VGV37_12300 [Aliidongia sp.]|uniref:hypothetical protein n=1 Tax=Aliidongia sp. TaxID=1914230 RepID=UPI002DDDB5C5|nr:hypothetical protein [Aliidongia sp.]HEV2675315.1 hypothetical protein [Aliidongia sp.]